MLQAPAESRLAELQIFISSSPVFDDLSNLCSTPTVCYVPCCTPFRHMRGSDGAFDLHRDVAHSLLGSDVVSQELNKTLFDAFAVIGPRASSCKGRQLRAHQDKASRQIGTSRATSADSTPLSARYWPLVLASSAIIITGHLNATAQFRCRILAACKEL